MQSPNSKSPSNNYSGFRATVACGIICESNGKVLMVHEIKNGKQVWNQPVGHLDPGESLFEAAVREAYEETGFRVILTGLVGVYLWQAGPTYSALRICFTADIAGGEMEPIDKDEIMAAYWLSKDELKAIEPEYRSPITKKCLDDYFAGKRYPLEVVSGLLT